jgi:hypothetical protein
MAPLKFLIYFIFLFYFISAECPEALPRLMHSGVILLSPLQFGNPEINPQIIESGDGWQSVT